MGRRTGVDASTDAGAVADTVDAAPIPQPPVLATNQGDIARFPDEAPIANARATFMRAYNIRESPQAGTIILGLPKGAVVTQIAQRTTYFLILFDNPKQAGTQLMGWVSKDAFSAVIADAGAPPTCPPGETSLLSDAAFCGRVCAADADCTAGTSCRGSANRLVSGKAAPDAVKVCVAMGGAAETVSTDGGWRHRRPHLRQNSTRAPDRRKMWSPRFPAASALGISSSSRRRGSVIDRARRARARPSAETTLTFATSATLT